ncbi:MAG: bifunctional adenosylcobinamide kinase/adenosylcobinamide-phosphate guanylyltransferase [Deltaproteobacteria bacterium]|nr:bifunctional adenosylcobinamide kinase/adenosylcobinamide-phosphate guanylyltransferase [Deltaproteobacteria bacterium]
MTVHPKNPLVLIGGGARSGKSAFALERALAHPAPRWFVATAEAHDPEMARRADQHRAERGQAFHTVEEPLHLEQALEALPPQAPVVIDCLTLWMSNLMLAGMEETELLARVLRLGQVLAGRPGPGFLVTNEVGMGLVPETPLGRAFRDAAGRAHQQLAALAGEVWLAALGMKLRLKPAPVIPWPLE